MIFGCNFRLAFFNKTYDIFFDILTLHCIICFIVAIIIEALSEEQYF